MNGKVVILLLGLSLVLCHAVPVKRQTAYSDSFNQLRSVDSGLDVMRTVESRSSCPGLISECVQIEFPLGQKALCYVYDRYMDYTLRLLSTPSDSPLFASYTANQYVAWKSLNSTCNWVKSSTSNSTLPSCTVPEIEQVCTIYRIRESFQEIKVLISRLIRESLEDDELPPGSDIPGWLQSNLTPEPESITSTLLRITGCTKNSEGVFSC